jgi:hypothetical protein
MGRAVRRALPLGRASAHGRPEGRRAIPRWQGADRVPERGIRARRGRCQKDAGGQGHEPRMQAAAAVRAGSRAAGASLFITRTVRATLHPRGAGDRILHHIHHPRGAQHEHEQGQSPAPPRSLPEPAHDTRTMRRTGCEFNSRSSTRENYRRLWPWLRAAQRAGVASAGRAGSPPCRRARGVFTREKCAPEHESAERSDARTRYGRDGVRFDVRVDGGEPDKSRQRCIAALHPIVKKRHPKGGRTCGSE